MTDVATEIAEIEAVQQTDNIAYWKDPQMQERYGELIAAQEAGTPAPAGPSANQRRIAEIEQLMAEPANTSEYWHSEKLQREYRDLLDGKTRDVAELPASELAEALGMSEDQAADFTSRMNTMTEEIGDTGDLDMAFTGLSDEAQGIAAAVLADPSKREAYIESMPVETLEELMDFVSRMPDDEVAALERALLL